MFPPTSYSLAQAVRVGYNILGYNLPSVSTDVISGP